MSKQKKLQQYIYKIDSSLLELKNWDLNLPLNQARKIDGVVVALADSQILSWINEINGTQDYDERAKAIKKEIKSKEKDLKGKMETQGTTPRRLTDLIGSLADLTSGSGDKGTPVVYIQGYFDNYAEE